MTADAANIVGLLAALVLAVTFGWAVVRR